MIDWMLEVEDVARPVDDMKTRGSFVERERTKGENDVQCTS